LEFSFWKLLLLIVSAFKGVDFSETPIHPPLGDILGPFIFSVQDGNSERARTWDDVSKMGTQIFMLFHFEKIT